MVQKNKTASPPTPPENASSPLMERSATRLFNGRELTPALENYLEIIFRLEMSEGAARAGAIAEAAGVSRSTVTSSLKVLKAMKLVEYAPYSLIHTTAEGFAIGRDIAHRHFVFREFLENVLLIEPDAADDAACSLEHVVPQAVIKRLGQFVLFLKSRPEFWETWRTIYAAEGIAKSPHGDAPHADSLRRKIHSKEEGHNPYR